MNVRDIRKRAGQNQAEFAASRKIPIGTLRNWEQGISEPPTYLVRLLEQEESNTMNINWNSIRLMKTLDELSLLTSAGFRELSEATSEDKGELVLFDESASDDDGAPIVMDCLLDESHHDAISYYDSLFDDVIFRVLEEDDEPFIIVKSLRTNDEVCIECGRWYFM